MFRRPYSIYVLALVVAWVIIGAFQPLTPGGQRGWTLSGMLALALVALVLMVLAQRSAARASRPKHRCAHCRYNRTGLPENAPCPECGAGVKSICRHCRGDMTGMEHRVCPTCGVMYGVETIPSN